MIGVLRTWLGRAVGDEVSLDAAVRAHGPAVWGVCRRLASSPEDAYQEIWLKVGRALPRFDPSGPASLRTWILRIADRHLIDLHRRERARGVSEPTDELVAADVAADVALDRDRRLASLEAALPLLPVDQRRVVLLHHLHGVSLEELAETEGVAVGTIKSRLHRGRARLRTLLGGGA
ncbi:MAG TPA: sigma-70 family RNA polymerase sigma factor [Myxococcota bacterium]|nr:sigma-70 family RNA polymerase sigma factor [Myxococcota bacterium]